ncbi:MAG: transketolase [Gammaproteobacteria bacterium]|nr:transketolase [Gammaproteobacteria bacterium]
MITSQQRANAIRALSMDAVQQAKSGHPGAPMGMADIAEVLWHGILCHNPANPHWLNRDRFVLSNGHASMLLYSLLHLSGYDVSIDDIKNFRQLHSATPGHPEYGYTPGIETTTGPLGQGIANAVGMALAEKLLATQFNREAFKVIDHYTYCFLGDGCMMEGISHEVCSFAGTLQLGKLIALWDDNNISIDGNVTPWFNEDTPKRFEAYGWQVIRDIDGHDPHAIKQALLMAQQEKNKPSLLCCKTTIGFGAPNLAGTAKTHGSPLGEQEIAAARQQLQWPHPPFVIPQEIADSWNRVDQGEKYEADWNELFIHYAEQYPDLAKTLTRRMVGELVDDWQAGLQQTIQQWQAEDNSVATRKASLLCLNQLLPKIPELLGGSADLTGSNNTNWQQAKMIKADQFDGDYLHYGVREFGMSAIMNGIALHGGFIPFGGTFLTFSDYARNAVRMAALMKQRVIFVYSHDSIGLGEDGPTHQPIEHAAMLRLTPNLNVWRPGDAVETAVAWQQAILSQQTPSCLLLTRQNIPNQPRSPAVLEHVQRGGYVLLDSDVTPEIILIATGSEVQLAMAAAQQCGGYDIRVVSMPCTDVFDQQDANYREQVLPANITKRIAIEAGAVDYWYKYVGLHGRILGLQCYGASAPAEELFEHFGLTVKHLVKAIKELFGETR